MDDQEAVGHYATPLSPPPGKGYHLLPREIAEAPEEIKADHRGRGKDEDKRVNNPFIAWACWTIWTSRRRRRYPFRSGS